MKDRWNERYGAPEFAYGKEPNRFFKEQLDALVPGKLLLPAEGEGRNAVYAATQGWQVTALDISEKGKEKAQALAAAHNVRIDYTVCNMAETRLPAAQYDAAALIYAHFPAHIKSTCNQAVAQSIKPGGTVIFEAFSKAHLPLREQNPAAGGPPNLEMLYSTEEVQRDFAGFELLLLEQVEVELSEGLYHNGLSSVIRCVARKPQ